MISIVGPNFNGARWLNDCLNSVANQTLGQHMIEMILVDDGSTDNSVKIMESYSFQIPGLQVVQHAHMGMPSILKNVALEMATGDYILFLDSDDFLGVEALERLHDFVSKDSPDIVAFQLEGLDRQVPRSMLRNTARNVDLVSSGIYKTLGNWKLCRRQFLDDNNLRFRPEIRRGEDVVFFAEAMLRAKVVSVVAGYPFYTVRGRSDGSSNTQVPWDNSELIDFTREMVLTIKKWAFDPNIANHFMIRAFNTNAMTVLSNPHSTADDIDRMRSLLEPFWSADIEKLIYTAENRKALRNFFGGAV